MEIILKRKLKILGITSLSLTDEAFPSACTQHDVSNELKLRENVEFISIDVKDLKSEIINQINPDFALILIHGGCAENGSLGGVIDSLRIPRNGSPAGVEAMVFDKRMAHLAISMHEIAQSPPSVMFTANELSNFSSPFEFPYILKPVDSGSSNGVQIMRSKDDERNFQSGFYQNWLAQPLLGDKEITVAVYPSGVSCKAKGCFLSLENTVFSNQIKTSGGLTSLIRDPHDEYEEKAIKNAEKISSDIYMNFGMLSIVRFDFIFNSETNQLYSIDINTLPGIYKKSLSSLLSNQTYSEFIDILVYGGLAQYSMRQDLKLLNKNLNFKHLESKVAV